MAALWKQEQTLHPTFASINRCLEADWFLLPYELRLQRAHAVALTVAGILSQREQAAIDSALTDIERKFDHAPCPDSDAEDLHTWVEQQLTAQAGDAGRKIHTARSRNDQVATLLKMFVIDAGKRLASDSRLLVEAMCERAVEWSEMIFPLQTHAQFAAPGNVGFWALRYAASMDRIRRHAGFLVSEWAEFCPLGSGAVAGSSIPIDRHIQAKELGFVRPSRNALESTSCRDEIVEWLAVAAQTALHLQALATDIIMFSQTPLGWTVYPKEFATGSSMMPNKSNPDAMELLRGEACMVQAAHSQAILTLKGLPSGYNRDLQCLKPIVHQAAARLAMLMEMTIAFCRGMQFSAERLAASCKQGGIGATLRMEAKVAEGIPLREAHHGVAEELKSAAGNADADVWADRADLYQTIGGASPAETRRMAGEILGEVRGLKS
ncbi:MAG: argininosuccinate lyase [Planctomycetia bacterium]|nr:argininosuccinate lyase [Planctomycetia bacterium]MCC7315635.1 argininosuccinate lyase [Planctomycetota bacterium]